MSDTMTDSSVPLLSTGQPSTLKTYREIALLLTSDANSRAVRFFDQKIAEEGEEEEVVASEEKMISLLGLLLLDSTPDNAREEEDV